MNRQFLGYAVLAIVVALLPFAGVYPIFAMKVMCYALFACAFNLLLGFTGLLSFGHAAFLGSAAYAAGHSMKVWGLPTASPVSSQLTTLLKSLSAPLRIPIQLWLLPLPSVAWAGNSESLRQRWFAWTEAQAQAFIFHTDSPLWPAGLE